MNLVETSLTIQKGLCLYMSSETEFFFGKEKQVLVVAPEPPAWALLNKDAYKIVSNISPDKPFTVEQLYCELLAKNIAVDLKDLQELLVDLIKSHVLRVFNEDIPQPHRKLKVSGIYFEITSKCNLTCNHCYVSAQSSNSTNLPQERCTT